MPSIRFTNLILFLGCCALILTALFMQYFYDMIPCALCITQRIFVMVVGVFAFLAYLHNPELIGRRVYAVLGILASVAGGGFSARHLWLQSLPADLQPACGPSLEYILDTFPFWEALDVLLAGDGNCADITWTFLGISIPGWTLVAFAGLMLINIWQLLRSNEH